MKLSRQNVFVLRYSKTSTVSRRTLISIFMRTLITSRRAMKYWNISSIHSMSTTTALLSPHGVSRIIERYYLICEMRIQTKRQNRIGVRFPASPRSPNRPLPRMGCGGDNRFQSRGRTAVGFYHPAGRPTASPAGYFYAQIRSVPGRTGVVATIMGLDRAIRCSSGPATESVYDRRGIFFM